MGDRVVLTTSKQPLHDAGSWLTKSIEDVLRRRDFARVAIPGGSAAAVVGEAKALLPTESWRRIRFTWVDERCVPFADPESNRGAAHRKGWLDAEAQEHELPLYQDGESDEDACARVVAALAADFANALDVVLFGLGEDGHIASLFPQHSALNSRDANVLPIHDSPKPPAHRLSLTLPILDGAPEKLVFAVGEGKRDALKRTLMHDPRLPLTRLHGVRIMTDLEIGEIR